MVWTRFKQIHLTSRTTAGFDSRYVLAVQAVRRTIVAGGLPIYAYIRTHIHGSLMAQIIEVLV